MKYNYVDKSTKKKSAVALTFKIIATLLVVGAFTFCLVWTITNWDTVKNAVTNGTNIAIKEDVNNAYKDGYNEGIKDKNNYTALVNDYKAKYEAELEKKTTLEKNVLELNSTVEQLTSQKTNLQTQVENLQNTVNQLQTTNDTDLKTIETLNNQISELNTQISEMTELSQNATSQINDLNNKINQLQANIDYYENYIASLEDDNQAVATFEYDGRVYNTQIVNKGSKVSITDPESTDYKIFNYWTVNGERVDLSTYSITTNTTFIADITYKYAVTFVVDNEDYNNQIIVKNGYATLPSTPTKDGYEFDGWSLNGVDIKNDINTVSVTENTTYTAVFTKLHTVIFMYNDKIIETQTVRNGSYATNITVEGYNEINCWTLNDSIVDIANQKIYSDTTFVGSILVDVTFDSDYLTQINTFNSDITSSTINSISLLYNTEKTDKLGTLTSGIDVYYTSNDGLYNLDFVNKGKIIAPTNCGELFANLYALTTLEAYNFDTSNVTKMYDMFSSCSKLTTLDISDFNTSNVTYMAYMFSGCKSLQTLNLSNFDTSNVTGMQQMFYKCSSLQTLTISNFNTSNVTNMGSMFSGCKSLQTLNLSNFDTSKVTDMRYMFNYCKSLQTLNLSNFDTSKVTNMQGMFMDCDNLTTLDLSSFDTSSVKTMNYMFSGCKSLQTLNLSNFNTSNVTHMNRMFFHCENLITLDLSNFDTSKVTDMECMFMSCRSLQSLNISNFNTSKVTDMEDMFADCNNLKTVIVGMNYTLDNLPV